ncbi:hypothetical protein BDW22DRAFT_1352840 [Trametopsis cervina]|nr:hypothetical protein BDW22DRAFT_1352840 [Trametopsis cervina]
MRQLHVRKRPAPGSASLLPNATHPVLLVCWTCGVGRRATLLKVPIAIALYKYKTCNLGILEGFVIFCTQVPPHLWRQ